MPSVEGYHYNRFSRSNMKLGVIFTLLYLIWTVAFVGMRPDHWMFLFFVLLMIYATRTSREIILTFGLFVLYWIIYDGMRVIPNFEVNPVHIIEPFNLEKSLFGLNLNGEKVIPGVFLQAHGNDFLSLLSGIFYLTWVPLPILFGLYLFYKDRRLLIHFSFVFLLTNLIGFVVYYLYPAAPPWYYLQYGNTLDYTILGDAARLSEFDRIVGVPLFQNMYTKNANVFAAIPSLHAAYPIVLFYFGLKHRVRWMSILFFVDIIGIWFAAVYSLHHYVIDLILGGLCAIFSIFVYQFMLNRRGKVSILDTYADLIRR